jgi:hypothetical protein
MAFRPAKVAVGATVSTFVSSAQRDLVPTRR